ncbi:hypothetical protein Ssi03_72440 [Sphaerisporangium siamense]|nr:hypothetical protein Ssi03_72440 [Sphaerisporangium siamense]
MQGSWNNGKAHYRCVFPQQYARANGIDHRAMAEAQLADGRRAERLRLDKITTSMPKRLTEEEITAMTTTLGDMRRPLRSADPQDKAQVYGRLGLRLTYEAGRRTVIARAELGRSCSKVCPRGDLNPHAP